jgi:hypothetical protein
MAEVHVIDSANSHPISIIKSSLDTLNSLIIDLMGKYTVTAIKRSRKRLLTF